MQLSDTNMPREMREAVEATMQPGEKLVHAETPQVPMLLNTNAGNMGYLFALALAFIAGIALFQEEPSPLVATILFTLSIAALFVQLRVRAQWRGAHYLLTSQRAIICRQDFFRGIKVQEFPLNPDLVVDVRNNPQGGGHIIFDDSEWTIGLLWVKDVEKTRQILENLLQGTTSPEKNAPSSPRSRNWR